MKFQSKKSLGQHFLLNPTTINKILDLAKISSDDFVLEIGPGPGVMTRRLVERAGRVLAVEKDQRFAEALSSAGIPNLTVIQGDFLEIDLKKTIASEPAAIFPPKYKWKVVANLPYNVATEILFRLLDFRYFFQSFHLMAQREVAERLVSQPGSRDYGILSVMTQIFSKNRIVMRLPPGAFTPPPKVHSAVVSFHLLGAVAEKESFDIQDLATFKALVRAAFGQRRKMIRNSIKGRLPDISDEALDRALEMAGINPKSRAEEVPIKAFAKAANALHSHR